MRRWDGTRRRGHGAPGGFDISLLEGAQLLVVSPGVATRGAFFDAARSRGLQVIGDIELFARAARAPVAGITGTNGKSTVTTLLAQMAARSGLRIRSGGNLGEPALDLLDDSAQLYVLELSSYQLETTSSLRLVAAAVLNVTADHLDRYRGSCRLMRPPRRASSRTARWPSSIWTTRLVAAMLGPARRQLSFSLRADSGADYTLLDQDGDRRWLARRGEALLPLSAMRLTGAHNAANALAALALGEALSLPLASMLEELRTFGGLQHRTQWVAEIGGVRYIDDSKGTNVGATLAAVTGYAGPLMVILGGDGKGQDFAPLRAAFAGKVRCALLIGRDAAAIGAALEGACDCRYAASLEAAVEAAAAMACPGDTVLLSPACASLDMFRDYAQRGRVFVAAVRRLRGMSSATLAIPQEQARSRGPALDSLTLILSLSIVLLGLVMVTSASITIAGHEGDPFAYLERQLMLVVGGVALAVLTFSIPMRRLEQLALPLLLVAAAMLVLVLVPGLGHVVNGSRRWLRFAGLNFQVSEAARVLTLVYIASYAVRFEPALRSGLSGLARPLALLSVMALLLLLEPDFGAASGTVRHRLRRAVPGGRAAALGARDAAGCRRLHGAAGDVLQLPHAAHDHLPRSVGRSRSTADSSSRSR